MNLHIRTTNKFAELFCYLHTVSVVLTICFGLVFSITAMNTVVPIDQVFIVGKLFAASLIVTFVLQQLRPIGNTYPYVEDDEKRVNFSSVQIAAPNPDFDGNAIYELSGDYTSPPRISMQLNTFPHTDNQTREVYDVPNPSYDGKVTSKTLVPAYVDYDTEDLVYQAKDISEAIDVAFPAPVKHESLETIIRLGRFLKIYPSTISTPLNRYRSRPVKYVI